MTEEKKFKVVFAPGCFDNFEGTQEELDTLIKELGEMFDNKTREEIEAMSNRLTDDDFDELPEEVQVQIAEALFNEEELVDLEKMGMPRSTRRLQ